MRALVAPIGARLNGPLLVVRRMCACCAYVARVRACVRACVLACMRERLHAPGSYARIEEHIAGVSLGVGRDRAMR